MTSENQIRLAIGITMMIGFIISVYFRRKAAVGGGEEEISREEEGPLLYIRSIGGSAFFLGFFIYLLYPRLIAWAQVDLPLWLRWASVGIAIIIIPFFYWMFSHLAGNITKTVETREEHNLITTGPYRYIRHPLYTFGTVSFCAVTLATANILIAVAAAVGLTAIFMRTPIEERKLIKRFGAEYEEYMRKTGRYFPKLRK